MQDDAVQAAEASELLESLSPDAPGYVPVVAIVELFFTAR
jgi:predicted nucleic-acid-binding protein